MINETLGLAHLPFDNRGASLPTPYAHKAGKAIAFVKDNAVPIALFIVGMGI